MPLHVGSQQKSCGSFWDRILGHQMDSPTFRARMNLWSVLVAFHQIRDSKDKDFASSLVPAPSCERLTSRQPVPAAYEPSSTLKIRKAAKAG